MARRKRMAVWVAVWASLPILWAQAAPQVPSQASGDWGALTKLKAGRRGDLILVEPVKSPGRIVFQERCRLRAVTASTLTCVPESYRKQRSVFPRDQVEAVWRVKTGKAFSPTLVVVGAIVGFAMGGVITDGNWDYPLAVLGAVGGAGYGLQAGARPGVERVVGIYRRPPEIALEPE